MREIEFRGKSKNSGRWVYGDLVTNKYQSRQGIHIYEKSNSVNCRSGYQFVRVDKNTLGQYTGLTDRNGTEIFEGDIVKVLIEPHNTNYAKENDVGVVKFGGDLSYVIDFSHDEDWLWNFRDRECAVIGNVFDNPELLGKVEG